MTKEDYNTIVNDYKAALRVVEANLNNLMEFYPMIDAIETRIKTLESIEEKCQRRGIDPDSIREIREKMRDISGARVTCQFRDDIPRVVEAIKNMPGIAVDTEKDYINNPKSNGYSSYHLCTFVQIYIPGKGTKSIPVEIQVRTMAQNLWASAEHIIRYKSVLTTEVPEVSERFASIAKYLAQIDKELIELRDYCKNKKPAN